MSGNKPEGVTVASHIEHVKADRINRPDHPAHRVRLVARGTKSPAFQAVFDNLDAMRDAEMIVSTVVTGVSSKKEASEIFRRYADVYGEQAALENIRVCLMRRRKDINEQLQLGERAVWSNDAGAPIANTGKELVADAVPRSVAGLSAASFELIWQMSEQMSDAVVNEARTTRRKRSRTQRATS